MSENTEQESLERYIHDVDVVRNQTSKNIDFYTKQVKSGEISFADYRRLTKSLAKEMKDAIDNFDSRTERDSKHWFYK